VLYRRPEHLKSQMLVNPPLPISSNDPVARTEATFRPYQRIVAEVLQVTATQAILSIDGITVVARLTSLEQATMLKEQRLARFIITQADENMINLKLLPLNQQNAPEMPGARQDLLARFLQDLNLAATDKNAMLLQAMVDHRLPISPDLFKELSAVLAQSGDWDADMADMAAAIKAAGLPLTAESLALALRNNGSGTDIMQNLYRLMQEIAGRNQIPEDVRSLLESAMKLFDETRATAGAPRAELARALEGQVLLNGRSLENVILEQLDEKNPFWPEKSLAVFSRLQTLSEKLGERELSQAISKYLDQAHQSQFWNIHANQPQTAEKWLEIPIYVQLPHPNGEENGEQARLRILRNPEQSGEKVDPANSRLLIEMEIGPGKTVQVNLSLTGKQARADVVVPDETLLDIARDELPDLEKGMLGLGYSLAQNNLRVGKPEEPSHSHITLNNGKSPLTVNVDLEI
jgi:hypothetical protein